MSLVPRVILPRTDMRDVCPRCMHALPAALLSGRAQAIVGLVHTHVAAINAPRQGRIEFHFTTGTVTLSIAAQNVASAAVEE